MTRIKIILLTAIAISLTSCASVDAPKPGSKPNPVLQKRLSNAEITQHQIEGGRAFTEVRFSGSLAPNVKLGCIRMDEVTSDMNPPALVYASKQCILEEKYERSVVLLSTGAGFAYYDLKRLADRSTMGASSVMMMRAFSDLSEEQRLRAYQTSQQFQQDREKVQAYCAQLTRIGPPSYEPKWAILHGMGVYREPRNGHYRTDVDQKALWNEVLKSRCTPKPPRS